MKVIDISTNDAMARTLPPAGRIVKFYDYFGRPFKGMVEYNQWFRPIFYAYRYGNRYRLNFVPEGWEEMEESSDED